MARRRDPDVVVVGAGPAGCATALAAARRGLRVELLHRGERARRDRQETLHPGIEPLLRRLGADSTLHHGSFRRHAGHAVAWHGQPAFAAYGADAGGPWLGFQVGRRAFDDALRAHVQAAGVTVTETRRIEPVMAPNGPVLGVRHAAGATEARFVVDAAGGSHWLSRRLGLAVRRYSPRLVARYGVSSCIGTAHTTPAIAADAAGWLWTAPLSDGTVAWVRLVLSPGMAPHGLEPDADASGADVTWRFVEAAAGPGYVLVGDAAFVLDPLSSHGVLHAVMSAVLAADAIADALSVGLATPVAGAYLRWSSARFATDVLHLRALYADLPRPPAWVWDGLSHGAGAR